VDLTDLRSKHPQLFKLCFNMGVDAERERVVSHLDLGRASGVNPLRAITSGAKVSDWLSAYREEAGTSDAKAQAFASALKDLELGTQSEPKGSGPASGSARADSPDLGDQVVAELEKQLFGRTSKADVKTRGSEPARDGDLCDRVAAILERTGSR
jgi:hypothetical protein